MARLPKPGGDNGNWGTILNDYLSQSLKDNGELKDNVVTNSVIAPDAVTATEIKDGTIQEMKLAGSIQAKLNQETPSWSTLVGRPTVVAAGTDQATARAAINVSSRPEIIQMLSALRTSFRNKSDGLVPATGDEGVPVVIRGGVAEFDNQMVVRDGLLQTPTMTGGGSDRAAYWNQPLVGIKRIGASFKIAAGASDANGAITLALWEYPIPVSYVVPNSPIHMVVSAEFWQLGVWEGGTMTTTGTFTALQTTYFAQPLADDWNPNVAGSGTAHRVEVLIDGDTAIIALPDGTTATVSDTRIASIPATVVCYEIYRHTANSAATAFEEIWAGTDSAPASATSIGEVARMLESLPLASLSQYVWHAPVSSADVTVPTSLTNITGLPPITITLPTNCTAVEIEASLYYSITSASRIIIGFAEGATTYAVRSVINSSLYEGVVTYVGIRSGMIPNTTHTFTLQHLVVGSGAVLKLDAPNGYVVAIKATPITTSI